MAKIHNLAFDYSAYDKAEEQEERAIKHRRNALAEGSRKNMVLGIFGGLIVIALMMALIFGRVELSSLYTQRTELENQLTLLQSENVSLESELAQKTNMTKVEEYAENTLGLQKLDKSQIEYVEIESEAVAEIVQPDDPNIFLKLKRWFSSVMEYIGL